jgi:peroxiredoxin
VLGPIGLPSRWTFYIGPDGRILDVDKHVHIFSHGADMAAKLTELGTPRI